MAEVRETHHSGGASGVAWFAVVLATVALVIAWIAYNRTGEDLEDKINDAVTSAVESAGEEAQEATDATERAIDTGPDGVDDGSQ